MPSFLAFFPVVLGVAATAAAVFLCDWVAENRLRASLRRVLLNKPVDPELVRRRCWTVLGLVLGGALAFGFFPSSFLAPVVGMGGGWLGAWAIEREKQARHVWRQFKRMPDFLELLSVALSAGYHFERAWALAVQFLPESALKPELLRFQNALHLSRSREAALDDLKNRLNNPRCNATWTLIRQSFRSGTPLESLLLEQARVIRTLIQHAIERKAQTAPIRLLFPILFFIFPSLFIAIFGPLFLLLQQQGGFF